MSIIGIDLGTGRNKACLINLEGRSVPVSLGIDNTMPSVIYFDEGKPITGIEAFNQGMVDPKNFVQHWKREMGKSEAIYTSSNGKVYTAKDCAIIFLKVIKEEAEKQTSMVINTCVITVPANYTDQQKADTIAAAIAAGFTCEEFPDGQPLLMHEPTAAFYSKLAGSDRVNTANGKRIVVDVGAGTTDITIANKIGNKYDVVKSNGVPALGGLDYTRSICDYAIAEFSKNTGIKLTKEDFPEEYLDVWEKAESLKHRLSTAAQGTVIVSASGQREAIKLTKDEVSHITKDLTDKIIECVQKTLTDAKLGKDELLEMIPIGGGSQFFAIIDELSRFWGSERELSDFGCPHLAVAQGAVLRAWQEAGSVKTQGGYELPCADSIIRDVTSHELGIYCLDALTKEPEFGKVLDSGLPMPSTYTKTFTLSEDGQTSVEIKVLQKAADSTELTDCLEIGKFTLDELPALFGKAHRIEVTLSLDKNGLLNASVYDPHNGKSGKLDIQYHKQRA